MTAPAPRAGLRWSGRLTAAALVAAVTAPAPAAALQTSSAELSTAVESAPGPIVRFAFPAHERVCGTGDGIVIRQRDGSTMFISGRLSSSDWRNWRDGDPPCIGGDVIVELQRLDGDVADVEVRVGRPPTSPEPRDLGLFTGQAAADWLLEEAAGAAEKPARQMILAASLAGDAVVWPGLLRLAKDRALPTRTRKAALHWLGRAAADEAAESLGGFVRDATEEDEIREAAVFGLSQLDRETAVPLLIEVYRTVTDPRVRSRALFWLADLDDPRALALFEEILVGGGG